MPQNDSWHTRTTQAENQDKLLSKEAEKAGLGGFLGTAEVVLKINNKQMEMELR